jgi:hypothetical protein
VFYIIAAANQTGGCKDIKDILILIIVIMSALVETPPAKSADVRIAHKPPLIEFNHRAIFKPFALHNTPVLTTIFYGLQELLSSISTSFLHK